MGAAAITTTGFPIDRARVASLLGFAGVQENSYGCIAACDYVIELGPEGGEAGGRLIAEGAPEELARNDDSLTGRYLRKIAACA